MNMSDATIKKTKYQVLVAYQKTKKGYYNQPMLSSKAIKTTTTIHATRSNTQVA